jgi:glycine oxidase
MPAGQHRGILGIGTADEEVKLRAHRVCSSRRPRIIESVTSAPDVVVVGAGIIGCAVGRELARRGARVRIFETRRIGAGATYASAGVLAPYIEAHERGRLFDLTLQSLAIYDQFVADVAAEAGIHIEYRRCGTLEVATDAVSAERMREGVARQHEENVLTWLDAAAARQAEPLLAPSIHGAVLTSVHGYVAVPDLTEALAWSALRHGAQIETTDRVTAIRPAGAGLSVLTADGTKWDADVVVVAAGSWSGQIETEGAERLAVKPIKGQLLRLRAEGEHPRHVVWGPDCYVVPWQSGLVLVGATVEDVGFDERVTVAGIRQLLDAVTGLLPATTGYAFVEARAGLRPGSADGLPIIRRASDALPQLIFATGHYRNGVLLAPLTAQLVADFIF